MIRQQQRLLLLLSLLVLAAGLGLRDPWPADEPRFALIARDMVLSGEWLVPRVGGEWYSDKPPLFMWLVAAGYKLTGSLRAAFLLPSLAAGLGMLALVYDLARRLWGREAAGLAALLLLLTVQFTLQARTGQIDALVSFWVMLGVYGLLRHLLLGPHWRWYFAAWVAMGLGIMTKGVGFLPALMFLPWAVVRRRWPERLPAIAAPARWWWAGPALALATVSLWLAPMLVEVAWSGSSALGEYRDDLLLRQTAGRYAQPWGHIQPFWYYLLEVIPWAWLPLTLALPWLVPAWRRRLESGDAATWLLLGWAACVLVFFSLSPGKRGVYILPALPAVVVAAAPFLDDLLRRRGVQALAGLAVAASALAGLGVAAWAFVFAAGQAAATSASWGFEPWDVVAAFTVLAVALSAGSRRIGAPAALALLIFGSWQIYAWWAAPLMNASRSGADLMARVTRALPGKGELALAGWKEQMLLQLERPVVHFGFRREPAAEARDAAGWLAAGAVRRLLIPARQMSPCFDPASGQAMGLRHRTEWRLVGPESLTGACGRQEPSRVRRYDPASGGALAAHQGEPDPAAGEERSAKARNEAHALAR